MARTVMFPNLLSEMAKRGETQKDLANLLKLNQPAISRRLRGLTKWTIEEVKVICEHYNKEVQEIF